MIFFDSANADNSNSFSLHCALCIVFGFVRLVC